MKGFIIFEDFKKFINCKEILDGDYNCVISDYPNGTFSGIINRMTGATCNKDDTYDFEVGALISLMKMCGRDKVTKACDELYKDDKYKNALQEMTENNEKLIEENNYLKYVISCRESVIESLENTRDLLINKNKELIEENKKLKDSCDKYFKEVESLVIKKNELIEENRAFRQKCINKWLYKNPTKREEMWEKIFELHKESDVIIKVKKEDVNTFLHEIENKIPEITWASDVKIFETKYTIKDIYFALKTSDTIYFRLWKVNKLSYSSDPYIYPSYEFKHIDYLPPMRWDLFKKGRLAVKVNYDNYKEFYEACEKELGKKPSTVYTGDYTVSICKKDGNFEIFTMEDQNKTGRKIVNWEDVR